MTVYVDDMRAPFGRMVMCHCWADTLDELFAMMDRIGVQRKWFQQPPKASWQHFDISMTKRALAIQHGAVETDRYGPVEHTRRMAFIDAVSRGDFDDAIDDLNKLCQIGRIRMQHNAMR